MKILCVSAGVYRMINYFTHYFKKCADCDMLFLNPSDKTTYSTYNDVTFITKEEIASKINNYDIVFGIDHGCTSQLLMLKQMNPKLKIGCYVLDFPMHCFVNNKNFVSGIKDKWNYIAQDLQKMDFLLFYQNADDCLHSIIKCPYININYPVNPIYYKDYERKDYIIYSGRICPQKGVNYLIDALSLLPQKIDLHIIGSGEKIDDIKNFLRVNVFVHENMNEEDKWKMYHECRFMVLGTDNFYIASLCNVEGISIGRTSIVFDYPVNRQIFGKYVYYIEPINILKFANQIMYLYKNKEEADAKASEGIEYIKNTRTFDIWTKDVISFWKKVL